MRALLLLLVLCCSGTAAADPLKSAACGERLSVLQAARSGNAPAAQVEAARLAATQACLGGGGAAVRPSPTAQPPLQVPPVAIEPPAAARPPVPMAPPPPPVAIERPPVITSCDDGGCWASDGSRLNRSGPVLIGPNGLCTVTGNVARCP
ncbi:MAG TPA: hypothetical protein VEA40_09925 [Ramlibacter sp.]|nr:hypothetical protein [Ramlibacter sp.]